MIPAPVVSPDGVFCSAVSSLAAFEEGTSLNVVRFPGDGPPYEGLRANDAWPAMSMELSFQGPSTTDQSGLAGQPFINVVSALAVARVCDVVS